MMNRFSALWLILGLAGGYAIASPAARAQGPDGLPFAVQAGDTVRLHFRAGVVADGVASFDCATEEVQGRWVRCRATESSFQAQREQRWYNLTYVVEATKLSK